MRIVTAGLLGIFMGMTTMACQDDAGGGAGGGSSNSGGSGAGNQGGAGAGNQGGAGASAGAGGSMPCPNTGPEDTAAACSNGCDDDGDGHQDCDDFDCDGTDACGGPVENSTLGCSDGEDNDSDGNIDCQDFDCEDRLVCAGEQTNAACSDGDDTTAVGSGVGPAATLPDELAAPATTISSAPVPSSPSGGQDAGGTPSNGCGLCLTDDAPLRCEGETAEGWMQRAQAFAGGPTDTDRERAGLSR